MTTRDDIIDRITRLFWHTDHYEWAEVEAVFADQVHLDYTSLQGGEPSTLAPSKIVSGWRTHFATIPAHQHLVANHLVRIDGTTATATAQFVATHHWEDHRWTLGGDYRFTLVERDGRWLIAAMTMTAVWQEPGSLLAGTAAGTER